MCYEFYLHEAVIEENTCICTYLSCPLGLLNTEYGSVFSRLYWPWQFWKLWASSFVVYSQFYCLLFPHDYIQLMHRSWKSHGRNTVFLHCILSGDTWFWFVPLPVMFNLISWLRYYLSGFSPYKFIIPFLWIILFMESYLGRAGKNPFIIKAVVFIH